MSDISFRFTLLDWLIAAAVFGWPGLLIGGALGAFMWRKQRWLGFALGALMGCALWFAAFILTR